MQLWHIIWFEIRKLTRMRIVLFNQFLLPMILIFIVGNALSGLTSIGRDVPVNTVTIMIVEQAEQASLASIGWKEFLMNPEISGLLKVQYGDNREEAESALRTGEVDFAVIIPPGFADMVMKGEAVKWEMILGKDQAKNHAADMILTSYLDHLNEVQAVAKVLPSNVITPASQSAPASYIELKTLNKSGKSYSSFQYYAAAMLIMFLLYSGITASSSLSREKTNKTLYRMNSMPISILKIFLGKIAGNGLVAFIQAVFIILGTSWLYGVDWGRHPLYLILICVLIVIISMLLAIVVTLFSKSSDSAQTIIQLIIVVMTFLSGGYSPIHINIIEKMGEFTVNHWALQGILRIMLDGSSSEILHHLLILVLFSVLLLLVGIVSYRKVGYHE